jgi:hypothetical protein
MCGSPAGLELPHELHLPVGRQLDHIGIGFKQFDPQQPIMVRRLLGGRNAQPFVEGIESI